MTWMEGQDEINNTKKNIMNKIKAGSVFLRSSTAHHHPDEFCQDREEKRNISIKSEDLNLRRKQETCRPQPGRANDRSFINDQRTPPPLRGHRITCNSSLSFLIAGDTFFNESTKQRPFTVLVIVLHFLFFAQSLLA